MPLKPGEYPNDVGQSHTPPIRCIWSLSVVEIRAIHVGQREVRVDRLQSVWVAVESRGWGGFRPSNFCLRLCIL